MRGSGFDDGEDVFLADDEEFLAVVTCPLQPYQSVGERSKGLQVN
jgi:hypothetical protein